MKMNYCPVCDHPTFETEFKLKDFVVLHNDCYDKVAEMAVNLMRCDRCMIQKGNWYEEDGGRIICRECRDTLIARGESMAEDQINTYLNEK